MFTAITPPAVAAIVPIRLGGFCCPGGEYGFDGEEDGRLNFILLGFKDPRQELRAHPDVENGREEVPP